MNWLFVDMDSFFASVEKHLNPNLRDKPVGVVPLESDHTCVIAASIEAKRLGIKVGTPVTEARAKCPNIQLIKARPRTYVDVHHQVADCINAVLPIYKAFSIDEWAIQLQAHERLPENATKLALQIKHNIRTTLSPWISCSVGIAPSRLLAKIASDLDKPDGFTLLATHDLPRKIAHLDLDDLTGISHGMIKRLHKHNIHTVEQLYNTTRKQAADIWGSAMGAHWWAGFHAIDEPEIQTKRRTMGHSNVLDPKLRSDEGARRMLVRLTTRLAIRLREQNYLANRLTLHVTYTNQKPRRTFEHSVDLPEISDTPSLLQALFNAWHHRPPDWPIPLKVGVTVSRLVPASQSSKSLFHVVDRADRLSKTLDTINHKFGPSAAYFGAMHDCAHHMDEKIAFGRIPELPKQSTDWPKTRFLRSGVT